MARTKINELTKISEGSSYDPSTANEYVVIDNKGTAITHAMDVKEFREWILTTGAGITVSGDATFGVEGGASFDSEVFIYGGGTLWHGLAVKSGGVQIGENATNNYSLQVDGGISGLEQSTDPDEPLEGEYVIWMSDGTEKGDVGDVLIASNDGSSTKWGTLFDHDSGSNWS